MSNNEHEKAKSKSAEKQSATWQQKHGGIYQAKIIK